jgi:hypothetical protein
MPTIAPKRGSVAVGQRRLLAALRAFRRGYFAARLPLDLAERPSISLSTATWTSVR